VSAAGAVGKPLLKWQYKGCYASWCETGWYSSPVIADLDGDGKAEVVSSAYSIVALDGESGDLLWRVKSGHDRSEEPEHVSNVGRTWAGIVLADVDGDGEKEIVTAHSGGIVSVYQLSGYFETGWPQHITEREFRSLAVDDLDNDGTLEIVAGLARLNHVNAWVLTHDGSIKTGWPQLSGSEGSAAGLYNDNIGIGDLDGDGHKELVIPSDTITIGVFKANGVQYLTSSVFHEHPGHDMDKWAEVPAYVEQEYELRGWGPCYSQPTYRANFAKGPANIVDLDGDGTREVVVMGNVHDCHTSPYTDMYITPFLFNADRTRFHRGGFDWTKPPENTGAPLTENYHLIESAQPNPVTVDLDGDGKKEILFPSYDGKMHAFWLDKTEHGQWPYRVYDPEEQFLRFASEPVVVDLNADGHPEVLFASWTQKGSHQTGFLHVLDYRGNSLYRIALPAPKGSWNWNGAMAAPTLGNIDSDPDLELVLNTAHSGVVAFDLPGSADADIYWGTGRGSFRRNGTPRSGNLRASRIQVNLPVPQPGDVLTYRIYLKNDGALLRNVALTNTLPVTLQFTGQLTATSGAASYSGGVVFWSGEVNGRKPVRIQYEASMESSLATPAIILNQVWIDDRIHPVFRRFVQVIAGGFACYLPLLYKGFSP